MDITAAEVQLLGREESWYRALTVCRPATKSIFASGARCLRGRSRSQRHCSVPGEISILDT